MPTTKWLVQRARPIERLAQAVATNMIAPSARAHDEFAGRDELRYTGFTPTNRADAIEPPTKNPGTTPS
jgi:hypothetical protein